MKTVPYYNKHKKQMKAVKCVFGMLGASVLLAACNNVDFKKTASGVPYKLFSKGKEKDTIAVGDIIKYEKVVKIKDSVLANSYGNFPVYEQIRQAANRYEDPAMEIFLKARKGDSIYIVQAMDTFIARNPEIETRTPFRKGDQIVTTIRILEIFKTPELAQADYDKQVKESAGKDGKVIEDYLAKNNIKAQKTNDGVYVQTLVPGTGPSPDSGQHVTVNYKGMHLSGEVFDSGTYPLQIGARGAIPGFEYGIKAMQKGGKAKVFIPSSLGYGAQGSPPSIKPNEILVFELELVDISNSPAPPPPPVNLQGDTTKPSN
jgi:FKBP-type peptidyl-prolyl cis-trans isomerase FkpA